MGWVGFVKGSHPPRRGRVRSRTKVAPRPTMSLPSRRPARDLYPVAGRGHPPAEAEGGHRTWPEVLQAWRPLHSLGWPSVRKHCGRPENCVKINGSPGTDGTSGRSVLREKVSTKSAASGCATRAASSRAHRKRATEGARFQMPCAMIRSKLRSVAGMDSIGAMAHVR